MNGDLRAKYAKYGFEFAATLEDVRATVGELLRSGAPEAVIDRYIFSRGMTVDLVRGSPLPAPGPKPIASGISEAMLQKPLSLRVTQLQAWLDRLGQGKVIDFTDPMGEVTEAARVMRATASELRRQGFKVPTAPEPISDPMGFCQTYGEFLGKISSDVLDAQ